VLPATRVLHSMVDMAGTDEPSPQGVHLEGLTITVSVTEVTAPGSVAGHIESPYGTTDFRGWLELLGQVETVVERSVQAASTRDPD
jgi:hypothetical protein